MHLNFDYPGTHTGQPLRIELSIHTLLDQKGTNEPNFNHALWKQRDSIDEVRLWKL